jgi:hypothetical protein
MNDTEFLLSTSDHAAHAAGSFNLGAHETLSLRIRTSVRVTGAGASSLAVDSCLASEVLVACGYNGTNIIKSDGTTGVDSNVIASTNANAALTFTTSGATLTVNVQWGPTDDPSLSWLLDCEVLRH